MSLRFLGAGAIALALIFGSSAEAKTKAHGWPLVRGKCLCLVGLAPHIKAKWMNDCVTVCNSPERKTSLRHVSTARVHRAYHPVRHYHASRQRYRTNASGSAGSTRAAPVVELAPTSGEKYLIAFRGSGGRIDEASTRKIAAARGETLKLYGHGEAGAAVSFLKARGVSSYHVLGFSAGAQTGTICTFLRAADSRGVPPPQDKIITVGLYGRARGCDDPRVVNYLDGSGHAHARERNAVDLGASTPHLDPHTGAMARVAQLIEASNQPRLATVDERPAEARPASGDLLSPLRSFLASFTPEPERTALYDISAHTVYLPDGRKLEAHAGLGHYKDNASAVYRKWQGPTPPNTYQLAWREAPFHGVRAIRLNPIDQAKMHGRDGILAHPYLMRGEQSHGCVAFRDYPAFRRAFEAGAVTRIVVVAKWEQGR